MLYREIKREMWRFRIYHIIKPGPYNDGIIEGAKQGFLMGLAIGASSVALAFTLLGWCAG